ncbi:uncharacterized protein LOC121377448 [Gigantopelta aegis]|uniref:uncharacterized protein LOC121377448 n=1 Tax=Gigantopelta aegis TaxID=1735272 RepID=UPI001B888F39|nr:uncharacterized protein LOC121377448 [Gigantopelta aegis]
MAYSEIKDKEERLKEFPHSFQMDLMQLVTNKKRRGILDKLLLERNTDAEIMCPIELNRNDNFASFLLFLLKDYDEASKKNAKVLKRDPDNIVARANRVRFLYKRDLYAADENLKKLEEMKKRSSYAWMQAVADAELAFCLASTSPPCYFRAVEIYRSVNDRYPSEYLWKFGEALTIRRGITLGSCSKEFVSDIVANTVHCNKLLLEIAKKADKPLNAKAWVQLGDLSNSVTNLYPPFDKNIVGQVESETYFPPAKFCFRQALELNDDDAFVLERSGRFFRHMGELKESERLLTNAIARRPTSFSHQHLALTLRKVAERRSRQTKKNTGTGQSTPSSSLWLKFLKQNFTFSKEDPLIKRVIYHLQKSADISQGCNYSALNDLAFLYLQTEEYSKAEDTFRKIIISSGELPIAPAFTVYAYEQTGLCCLRKSEKAGISDNGKDAFFNEGIFYLTSAVETAARHASEIPSLHMKGYEERSAFRTVTDMLQNEYDSRKDRNVLKEMARLYELVGKYKTSLDIYKKLCLDGPVQSDSCEISILLIENYLTVKDYNNAKLCLSLLLCTCQATDVPRDLVNRVYMETARNILQEGREPHMAHDSFKRAFELKYRAMKIQDADGFDVMILHDEGNTETFEASQSIQKILETCTGLSITRNLEAAFAAKTEISSYELLIGSVQVLVIVLNPDPPDKQWKYWIELALTIANDRKNMTIICLTTGSDHPVTALQGFRTGRTPADDKDHTWLLDVFPLIINP